MTVRIGLADGFTMTTVIDVVAKETPTLRVGAVHAWFTR